MTGDASGFRAKDHARYSMVCKKWKVQLTLLCAPTLSQICGSGTRGCALGGALRTTCFVSTPLCCAPVYPSAPPALRLRGCGPLLVSLPFCRYKWRKKMVTLLPLFNQRRWISRKDNPLRELRFGRAFRNCTICALIITALSLVIGLLLVGKYEDGWDVSVEVVAIPFFCILLPCAFVFLFWFGYCFYECFSYCRYQTALCSWRPLRSP